MTHRTPASPESSPPTEQTWLHQAMKFGIVGVSNTMVDWGLYFILTRWLGLGTLPVLAKALSYGAGILNSYIWNKRWTFRSRQRGLRPLLLFITVNVIALGVNAGVLQAGLSFGTSELIALALATGITLLWNFFMSKRIVFQS